MKGFVCAAVLFALATWTAAAAPPDARRVRAQGCVQPGVESGCLVLRDAASGTLYSLLVKGARPTVGAGIDFTGTHFNGATTCMQGTPVQVSSWTRNDTLRCSASKQKNAQKSVQ